jgi:membrane associated rhomboid family serine protease
MLDEAKTDRWPYATVALMGANLLVFGFELSLGVRVPPFLQQWGLDPAGLRAEFGVRNTLTLASSMFLQVGWFQLLGGLWFLWVFGDAVEESFGWPRFAMLYLVCGLCGNVAYALASSGAATPAVGAGGAIAGVVGAGVVLWPRAHLRIPAVLVVFVALMLFYELGLRIGVSATILNLVGGFGIGGGPVLFALSVLLTLGWFVVAAQRRRGGVSLDGVLKVWTVPLWLVLVFFCLQDLWSTTAAIVRPDFGRALDTWAVAGGLLVGAVLARILPRRVTGPAEPAVPGYYLVGAGRAAERDAGR